LGNGGSDHSELGSRDRHDGVTKEATARLIDRFDLEFPGQDMFGHGSLQ